MDFVQDVESKIKLLKEKDPELKIFGAWEHKYQFGDKLTEAEVKNFEEKFGLTLPEDYKTFITRIGNGGAGPNYGIIPLDIINGPKDFKLESKPAIDLSKAFPFTESWNADWISTFDWDNERPDDELVETYFDPSLICGTIPLCHYGHGNMYFLVTKGKELGNMWFDGRADFSGITPEADEAADKERITFSEWYLNWLTSLL